MQYTYKDIAGGEFVKTTFAFTGHLRRQYNLISNMQSTCPKLATRWTAMGIVCKWLLDHHIRLFQHIDETSPSETPPSWWWVIVSAVSALSQHINVTITKLQSKDLLISQQTAILQDLTTILCTEIRIEGPFLEEHMDTIDKTYNSTYGLWSVTHNNVNMYLQDQGMFIQDILFNLGYEESHRIVNIVGIYVARVVDGITKIQAERNSPTDQYTIPPVLPHQLVQLRGAAFTTIVVKHLSQLQHSWTPEKIEQLEIQHRELRFEYQQNQVFAKALDACNYTTSFSSSWAIVGQGRFDILRDFCGGIGTVFPNTATVESDFSILGWEKDEYRKSLTDLSLEGIMQCKQFELFSSLA